MQPEIKKMITLAYDALDNHYAPYSNYPVGCAILADNGKFYAGCNVENASFSLVLCAESGALSAMIADGGRSIKAMVIVNGRETVCYPCGACRQRLTEFAENDTITYLCDRQKILEQYTLDELLPHRFSIKNLKPKG